MPHFRATGYGKKVFRLNYAPANQSQRSTPPEKESIDYPDLDTPCKSKFPVPPIPQKVWKNNKKILNAAKSSRPNIS